MTSKQRAELRAKANGLDTLFQVGKSGITDTLVQQTETALNSRELIKLRVLENAPITVRKAADELAALTGADVVQVIGTKMVLYRENTELRENEKRKAQAKKAPSTGHVYGRKKAYKDNQSTGQYPRRGNGQFGKSTFRKSTDKKTGRFGRDI